MTGLVVYRQIPDYEVIVDRSSFSVYSLLDGSKRNWTSTPIPIFDDIASGSLRIVAGYAHKWSVDLVVSCGRVDRPLGGPFLEIWRVSPWRVRRRAPIEVGMEGLEVKRGYVQAPTPETSGLVVFSLSMTLPATTVTYEVSVDPVNGEVKGVAAGGEKRKVYDVFISYKRDDHAGTRPSAPELVAEELSHDFEVWFDRQEIGSDFKHEIQEGIDQSRTFLVFYTDHTPEESDSDGRLVGPMNQRRELDKIVSAVKGNEDSRRIFTYYMGSHQDSPLPEEYSHERWHVMYSSRVSLKELVQKVKMHLHALAAGESR